VSNNYVRKTYVGNKKYIYIALDRTIQSNDVRLKNIINYRGYVSTDYILDINQKTKIFDIKKIFTMDKAIKTILGSEFNTNINSVHNLLNSKIQQYKNYIIANECHQGLHSCVTTIVPAVPDLSVR